MTVMISNQAASSAVQNLGKQLDAGALCLYAGTQPANANTNTSGTDYIVAELPFSTVAGATVTSTFTAATTGALATTAAISTGIATFYAAYSSSRARVMFGSVSSGSASDLNFNTNNVVQGVSVTVTSFSIVIPEQ